MVLFHQETVGFKKTIFVVGSYVFFSFKLYSYSSVISMVRQQSTPEAPRNDLQTAEFALATQVVLFCRSLRSV